MLLVLGACGAGSSGDPAREGSKTSNTADISEGVQPDGAAVKLLPQSYKDKGEMTVAMDLHYPPTTFLADDNSTPIGLNPDMARLIAKKLGLKLKFENTAFDTIIPGLDGGRYDFTATTMPPARAAEGAGHDRLLQWRGFCCRERRQSLEDQQR